MVYEGIAVYKTLVILESCGASGESECVVYMILSVHEGVRLELLKAGDQVFIPRQG